MCFDQARNTKYSYKQQLVKAKASYGVYVF